MNHETHLSAQQVEAQTQVRFSRPHENSGRTQSHSPPPQSRTKRTRRLNPSNRLKKRHEFLAMKRGNRLVGHLLCLDCLSSPSFRFGITASGRYGNAPERNRFKRLVREAIRSSLDLLPQDITIHVVPRQRAKGAKMDDIRQEILRLLQ